MRTRIVVAATVLLALTLAVTGVVFVLSPRHHEQKEAEAREKLAFVSLTDRLPQGKPVPPTKALSPEAKERWESLDEELAAYQERRAELLRALHEKTRRFFVESPGLGPERRMFSPEDVLLDEWPRQGETNQPGEAAVFPTSQGEPLTRGEPNGALHSFHRSGLSAFLYPTGFGYVKDREHVSGFKSHGFRYNPFSPTRFEEGLWGVRHIQLVGILSHEKPVVYLTDQLPSMEQVRQSKTRIPDLFEEAGLPALRAGDDLFLASKGDAVRMLGALRATKTCQQCHDADVGDLLGAFSYTLRRTPGK